MFDNLDGVEYMTWADKKIARTTTKDSKKG